MKNAVIKWLSLLSVLTMIGYSNDMTVVLAQDDDQVTESNQQEFPYNGYYATEENRYIRGFYFDEHTIYIIFPLENEINTDTKNFDRWEKLYNHANYVSLNINPFVSSEEVEKWREENLPNLAEIYTEVAKQITPDMTRQQVDAMIDAQIPSVDTTNAIINTDRMWWNPYVKLNAPTIFRSQNLWRVEIYDNLLLRFEYEESTDGETITDDYGVTYTKTNEKPENIP
ncbi:hypothetical protein GIY11_10385 [Aerococcaceae bacterium DSM 109653]|uniref:Uncharacterized protein n=1 Tax=Fundicoccus ignavus TaxID=2664442 RepID=A0A6I2GGP7_9LACT|nr:hypothetical protein [Fundicoccus ignavus]MRI82416.1 hypothetical protein [Fundicoccus ignavus]MRI86296.1 hypothetical protein [Fundicoccus ignavus]